MMGIFLTGYFISEDIKEYDEGIKASVVIIVGAMAYRVYMTDNYNGFYNGCKPGDMITIRARPYVSKKGAIAWTDGEPA